MLAPFPIDPIRLLVSCRKSVAVVVAWIYEGRVLTSTVLLRLHFVDIFVHICDALNEPLPLLDSQGDSRLSRLLLPVIVHEILADVYQEKVLLWPYANLDFFLVAKIVYNLRGTLLRILLHPVRILFLWSLASTAP